jgi:plasmid stabilization system protein ParE
MQYKITASNVFSGSLHVIIVHLSEISVNIANNFLVDLRQQISTLAELPNLYPKYEHINNDNYEFRKMVVTGYNYTVFYQVLEDTKEVKLYDIIHQMRDIDAALSKFAA